MLVFNFDKSQLFQLIKLLHIHINILHAYSFGNGGSKIFLILFLNFRKSYEVT